MELYMDENVKNIKVYLVLKNNEFITAFSSEAKARHYCNVNNAMVPSFAKQDDELYIVEKMLDEDEIDSNKVVKPCWDYVVYTDKDISNYGEVKYLGTSKDIVDYNKQKDVEYFNTYIGCRSYVSKDHAYNSILLELQMYEQNKIATEGLTHA